MSIAKSGESGDCCEGLMLASASMGTPCPRPHPLQVHGGATSHQQEEAGFRDPLTGSSCARGQALCLSAPPSR